MSKKKKGEEGEGETKIMKVNIEEKTADLVTCLPFIAECFNFEESTILKRLCLDPLGKFTWYYLMNNTTGQKEDKKKVEKYLW